MKSRGITVAIVVGVSVGLMLPAQAQFWDWGNRQRQYQQQPFGGWFDQRPRDHYRERDRDREYREREAPVDYSRAPAPTHKKPEATTSVLVVGDANADWLAYGLEEAFAEKPEIGIVRKHRTDSGLIRYDSRRDSEWATVAREIVTAEKPKFIVMMIGNHDRQAIRERAPAAARPGAPKANPQPAQPAASPGAVPVDPEQQAADRQQAAEAASNPPPEQARPASSGPWEFRTEKWEVAYIKRVDATIAALKSAGVPVLWVGLPSQRGPKASGDSSYLNEIYRSRAEKAGITYVDIWDGFVDEGGRFSPQGPDYEGQTRRLRTGDGVYFTKFGARKLAHYVERELQRHMTSRGVPVALPVPEETGPGARPGGTSQRPAAGPVVPLTATGKPAPEELLGGRTAARAPATDATATRVLTKGEPIAAPSGRADDFSWPRGKTALPEQPATQPSTAPSAETPPGTEAAAAAAAAAGTAAATAAAKPATKPKRRARPNYYSAQRSPFFFQGWFR